MRIGVDEMYISSRISVVSLLVCLLGLFTAGCSDDGWLGTSGSTSGGGGGGGGGGPPWTSSTTTSTTNESADDESGEPPPSCDILGFQLDVNDWNLVELATVTVDDLCLDLGTYDDDAEEIRVRLFAPSSNNWPTDALPLLVFSAPPLDEDNYNLTEYDDILEPIADAGVVVLIVQRVDAVATEEDPIEHAADGILCGLRWLTTDPMVEPQAWERAPEAFVGCQIALGGHAEAAEAAFRISTEANTTYAAELGVVVVASSRIGGRTCQ